MIRVEINKIENNSISENWQNENSLQTLNKIYKSFQLDWQENKELTKIRNCGLPSFYRNKSIAEYQGGTQKRHLTKYNTLWG